MSPVVVKREAPERQGSGCAPHPAVSVESTADASELGVLPTVQLRLGCFNCGVDQTMLSKYIHQKNLGRVIAKAVRQEYKALSCQAYMTTWQAGNVPGDHTSVTLTLLGKPEVIELPAHIEPQLVIMVFIIAAPTAS